MLVAGALLALGCQEGLAPTGSGQRSAAVAQAAPTSVTLGHRADLSLAQGRVVLRGSWGSGPGEFGRRDEGSRPGPMALAVADDGTLHVLDQVNRRVQRRSADGRLLAAVPISSETTEDLALAGKDIWTLVLEPGANLGYRVERYAPDSPALRVPLDRGVQLATGLFATGPVVAPHLWVEQRHDTMVQVVAAGRALPMSQQNRRVLGQPHRGIPGAHLTALRMSSQRAVVLRVDPALGASKLLQVNTPLPLVAIQELLSHSSGRVYLGLFMAREAGPPNHDWSEVRKVVLVWRPGQQRHQVVELAADQATDVFRPVAVGPGGDLYQLQTTEHQVLVRRWEVAR